MIKFLKSVIVTTLGFITSFFIIIILFILLILFLSPTKNNEIQNNSILYLKFDKPIIDQNKNQNLTIGLNGISSIAISLEGLLESIEAAKTDDKIIGIFIEPYMYYGGIATTDEIRKKLEEFKNESNKFVITYSEFYSQASYFLSSISDNIYMQPKGMLDFKGLAYNGMFFTETLERIGIEPQIIRHGKFKSAIEPFTKTHMSEENKEQTKIYINNIWDYMLKEISNSRNINTEDLNYYAENLIIKSSADAKKMMFIDSAIYKDQVLEILKNKSNTIGDINLIELLKYDAYKQAQKTINYNKIAVLYASGNIVGGEPYLGIGSEEYSEIIRDIKNNNEIKALVLRVNSPGGSALASETILRELILTKQKKPVIVSMGDVAASGGYYISCYADTIVCNPTTITGSIGVFGMLFNAQNMLNDKLGIYVDTVKTGEYADLGSIFRPMSKEENNIIQEQIDYTYNTFIDHVANGRNLDKNYVEEIAQGRVWSGVMAKEVGLIDVLGGLETAINIASKNAKLKNYEIVSYPKVKTQIEEILELMEEGQISEKNLNFDYNSIIKEINNIDKIQARLPYYFLIN